MTDHEEKALKLLADHSDFVETPLGPDVHLSDPEEFVSAIVTTLREAEAGERREIMNLLGYDENGEGLTSTSSWLTSGDVEAGHKEITICHDPYYELEGALIDLRRQGADKVCISTIERVQAQLAAVSKRAAAIRSRNDE